jgi:hypothetical protein
MVRTSAVSSLGEIHCPQAKPRSPICNCQCKFGNTDSIQGRSGRSADSIRVPFVGLHPRHQRHLSSCCSRFEIRNFPSCRLIDLNAINLTLGTAKLATDQGRVLWQWHCYWERERVSPGETLPISRIGSPDVKITIALHFIDWIEWNILPIASQNSMTFNSNHSTQTE